MAATTSQTEMRKSILSIHSDTSLTTSQRASQTQQILTNLYVTAVTQPHSNCAKTCQHYKNKKCSQFHFDCCQIRDPCHRCHLARGCEQRPPLISSIVCSECQLQQAPSQRCINESCQVEFSKSYCEKCKIWTDVEIFHCDKCGVCRVGKESDVFHCDNCEACFGIEGRSHHRCAKTKLKDTNCPICLESVHTAQKASNILPCGHVVHGECWKQAAGRGEYRCPTCRKSLINMKAIWGNIRKSIALQPIPRGFFPIKEGDVTTSPYGDFVVLKKRLPVDQDGSQDNTKNNSSIQQMICEGYFPHWSLCGGSKVKAALQESLLDKKRDTEVWCYDCESRSVTQFHFLGLECKNCGGFNTTRE